MTTGGKSTRCGKWTPAAIRALGARTDVPTAYEIITGRGRREAYRAVERGDFPVPVIRVGARLMVVPVQPILELLGLEMPAGGAPSKAPPATNMTPLATEVSHDPTRPGD